jgi:salicylate hydroxylase
VTTSFTDETGEFIGIHQWKEEVLREIGGEFLFLHVHIISCPRFILIYLLIQHAGLRKVLYDAAIAAGAEVHAGATVVSVSGDGPHVTLTTGETLLADVIIGADGCSSVVQRAIVGKHIFNAAPCHSLFYR